MSSSERGSPRAQRVRSNSLTPLLTAQTPVVQTTVPAQSSAEAQGGHAPLPTVVPSSARAAPAQSLEDVRINVANLASDTASGRRSPPRQRSLSDSQQPSQASYRRLADEARGNVQEQRAAPSDRGVSRPRIAAEFLDGGAALTSVPVFSGAVGMGRGALSGLLWGGSAITSGVDDYRQGSRLGVFGDVLSGVAGAADTVNSVFNYVSSTAHDTFAQVSAGAGYVSNAAWAVSGVLSSAQAIRNLRSGAQSTLSSGLQLAGGALNTVGALAGFEATRQAYEDPVGGNSTSWGFASAAAWTVGSAFTALGNHLAVRNQSTVRQPDLEEG